MVSVDEHTQVGIEIVSQGAKLTEQLILKMLEALLDLISEDKNNDYLLKDDTKDGQQKIQDLIKKHEDTVMPLDENVTKDQVNDYKKEFKKMGVDFSVVKTDEDSYSFFFSSKQADIIEKALKNIVERKSKESMIENDNAEATNDLDINNVNVDKEEKIQPENKFSDIFKGKTIEEIDKEIEKLENKNEFIGAFKEKPNNEITKEIEKFEEDRNNFAMNIAYSDDPKMRDTEYKQLEVLDGKLEKMKDAQKVLETAKEIKNDQQQEKSNKVSTVSDNSTKAKEVQATKSKEKESRASENNSTKAKAQAQQTQTYSMRAVKEIDAKLKAENKDKGKVKNRSQNRSR
ncbi:hypothetical protein [Metabacillus fastidiosus]|uniref:hypothetical protein n=1 Tax=Metabacillus fastidiosus TaxID=1458 RepID=UPI002E22ABAF|nr:DUF3801 domain-containing protein [Metabacillus fastidiosus]